MKKENQLSEFSWIDDIDFESCLHGDSKLFYEQFGKELFVQVWTKMLGVNIDFSERPIWEARKLYILKNFDGQNHKQLALQLGVSQDFIYDTLYKSKLEKRKPNEAHPDLFLIEQKKSESA